MLFKTPHHLSLLQGKLAPVSGCTRIVGLDGRAYGSEEVAFAIPDDEAQAAAIAAAGYRVHTPMSMQLGEGATGL